ncbi:FadR/GntR family transcriptional regulator [Actinomadura algeriensis]|uniref:DNA-binding FadR family transcriptional regulator n=1 Tax=Actinomadura algeriensis TaxID=1679523 RepID=A0ABR9K2C1_9ACTN|nr:FadR/GntR family transcriptional regulator [Actinomadura algeriensis]MBE1536977.1 DNA-binding FadR family transcriptional regulator [Actinomadura algeriensis]
MVQPRVKRGVKVGEAIAQDIVRKIVAEGLAPGTPLPSEAQMIEEYGVGRGSLREALRILEVHGLISIKPGPRGGPMVGEVSAAAFGQTATLFFQAGRMTFRELVEARLVMEPVMARLAAERRDPAEVERLTLIAGGTPLDDDGGYLEHSGDFHRLVASMSGNGMLDLFSGSLGYIFHDRVSGMFFPKTRRAKVREAHADIARAIGAGDADEAERLMREHMQEYATYIRRKQPALMNEIVGWR